MQLDLVKKDYKIALNEEKNFEIVGYDDLMRQVNKLGEYLVNVEVTEDNLQENKKLVAQVRKSYETLNKNRIAFKKNYLLPLDNLEQQVKELSSRVKSYEATVRVQISELEEREREQKEEQIKEIFNKRLRAYGSEEIFRYEDFFERRFLNKSLSINKVEELMVEWLENRKQDLNALTDYAESIPQSEEEIISRYILEPNVASVITYFTEKNNELEAIKEAKKTIAKPKLKKKREPAVLISIKEKDLEKVKQLLDVSEIDYKVI